MSNYNFLVRALDTAPSHPIPQNYSPRLPLVPHLSPTLYHSLVIILSDEKILAMSRELQVLCFTIRKKQPEQMFSATLHRYGFILFVNAMVGMYPCIAASGFVCHMIPLWLPN